MIFDEIFSFLKRAIARVVRQKKSTVRPRLHNPTRFSFIKIHGEFICRYTSNRKPSRAYNILSHTRPTSDTTEYYNYNRNNNRSNDSFHRGCAYSVEWKKKLKLV